MNIQDLKIGDHVMYKDDPYKVRSLNGTIACIEPVYGKLRGVLVESLTPTPITFDILTQRGWSHLHDEIRTLPFDFGTLNVVYDKSTGIYIISVSAKDKADTVVLRRVKYVHELQHVLWALGIEENLKLWQFGNCSEC